MVPDARARLEALLRARQLDSTLKRSTVVPPAATGLGALDGLLGGGLPRGHLSEIVGPRSSGRTSLLGALLAAANARGESAALIDPLDTFDPESAAAAGVELSRLLWIRGLPVRGGLEPALDRALKATGLVLEAGGFGLVALDLADVPAPVLRRVPFVTWARLARALEGRRTAGVLLGATLTARSPGGVTMALRAPRGRWGGSDARAGRFCGFDLSCRVVRARPGPDGREAVIRVGA